MMALYLLFILLAMVGNAFFSGMETGMISINRLKLRHLIEEETPWAVAIQAFLDNPARLLGTTLLGTNICMIMASVLAAAAAERIHPALGEVAAGALMTILVLICCEYIPKSWFRAHPLARCRHFIGILHAVSRILRPLVILVTAIANRIVRDPDNKAQRAPFMSREDLIHIARTSAEEGALTPKQRMMLLRVSSLSETPCSAIMTPRANMRTLPTDAPVSRFFQESAQTGFSTIPVFDPAGKTCIGLVNLFDLMPREKPDSDTPLTRLMKPAQFARHNMPVTEIFPLLRRARQSMCLITSAKGEIIGLLTVEDILRLIIGGA